MADSDTATWGWLSTATVTCDGPYPTASGDTIRVTSMLRGCFLFLPSGEARLSIADMQEFGEFLIEGARVLRERLDVCPECGEPYSVHTASGVGEDAYPQCPPPRLPAD